MSFLTQSAIRRVRMLRAVPRAVARSAPQAAFSTSVTLHKSVTESAKETVTNAAQKLNHAVGDTVVGGIDMGAAVNKVKDAMPDMGKTQDRVQGKASELSGEAKGKASQVAGEAKGKAHEVTGKAKSAADDLK